MVRDGEPITYQELILEFAEAAVIFSAVALTSLMAFEVRKLHYERREMLRKLEETAFDGTQWKSLANRYLTGLGSSISQQFRKWQLTASEADIALFMIKGFSHKEIAGFRNSNEATVRQQASSVFRKSGLRNHRELSAFFLEDLAIVQDEISCLTS